MKNTGLLALTTLFVFLCMASPALARTHWRVVTAPYWCGTYYSSYPCTYQPYSYFNSYNYSYENSYYNYENPYYGYIYPPLASPQNGYCPNQYYYSEGECYSDNSNPYDNGYNGYQYPTY